MNTTETILNRVNPCNCGCGGKDSQHAKTFKRVVSDVKLFDSIEKRNVNAFRHYTLVDVIAEGVVMLNGQPRVVYFAIGQYTFNGDSKLNGQWFAHGWCLA
jgi:hypothetical protein